METTSRERYWWLASLVAVLIIGFLTGREIFPKTGVDFAPLREKSGDYSFISPLLTCQLSEKTAFKELAPLSNVMEEKVREIIAAGVADKVSVYFRDLNTGLWTGVGENEGYEPASLLKVPLMIAYEKSIEAGENSFSKMLTYTGADYNEQENIKPETSITIGKPYSAKEMIRSMIVNSDNNAYLALYKDVNPRSLLAAFTDLGITVSPENQLNLISPKQYSLFLRVLYNASYLDREDSENALKFLSEATFKDGIAASLPETVKFAHKFGERGLPSGVKELHDCGIVYYPDRPYILCVMTRGNDISKLEDAIKAVSKTVYDFVQEQ